MRIPLCVHQQDPGTVVGQNHLAVCGINPSTWVEYRSHPKDVTGRATDKGLNV